MRSIRGTIDRLQQPSFPQVSQAPLGKDQTAGDERPLLLLHSPTDPVVPFRVSVEMEEIYRNAGALAVLKPVDALQTHAFWNDARFFPQTIEDAVEFFRRNLKAKDPIGDGAPTEEGDREINHV